jgi:uncharacterized C2H2 Zn-finger protein
MKILRCTECGHPYHIKENLISHLIREHGMNLQAIEESLKQAKK